MQVVDIPVAQLVEAIWNPNVMTPAVKANLSSSVRKYGVTENLVVRKIASHRASANSGQRYEVLSGNQRLQVIRELGHETVPCLVVDLNDADARLLAQAMNEVHGEDDPGRRADLLREVLQSVKAEDVAALLPESVTTLKQIASLGQQDMADHLRAWNSARHARLRHVTFQLTPEQEELVLRVLDAVVLSKELAEPTAVSARSGNPNKRGNALYALCQRHLEELDA